MTALSATKPWRLGRQESHGKGTYLHEGFFIGRACNYKAAVVA